MTNETKIGLLVGLAFMIVLGILLSNHISSTTEPVQAPLANTADSVRDSVVAPVTDPPPITVVTSSITPRDAVGPRADQSPSRQPETIVRVGGPVGNSAPIEIRQTTGPAQARIADSSPVAGRNPPASPGGGNSLSEVARANGETIVDLNGRPESTSSRNNAVTEVSFRKYTALPGDTLSRIAGRFLGGNTKANRDLIVKSNPSLQADPNKIIVGKAYNIPSADGAPANTPVIPVSNSILPPGITRDAQPIALAPAAPTAPVATTPTASDQSAFWYTVKENDSLWSIAADQLGSGGSWTAIKELNADILKGSDVVHPNMRLRLPAKPLASAQ